MWMRSVVFLLLLSIFIKSSDSVKCEGNPKKKIFYNEGNYKFLDLSGCENERLIIDEDLKGRNYLIAANNVFSKLEANTFVKIPNLLIIDLHDNQIEEISKEAFTGLSKLTNLDLKYNSIEELRVGTFDPLVALSTLKLEHNKINVLKEGIFDKNLNLTHTHLDGNQIIAIGSTVLKPGKNWYLRGNKCVKGNEAKKCVENYKLHHEVCISFEHFLNNAENNDRDDETKTEDDLEDKKKSQKNNTAQISSETGTKECVDVFKTPATIIICVEMVALIMCFVIIFYQWKNTKKLPTNTLTNAGSDNTQLNIPEQQEPELNYAALNTTSSIASTPAPNDEIIYSEVKR